MQLQPNPLDDQRHTAKPTLPLEKLKFHDPTHRRDRLRYQTGIHNQVEGAFFLSLGKQKAHRPQSQKLVLLIVVTLDIPTHFDVAIILTQISLAISSLGNVDERSALRRQGWLNSILSCLDSYGFA